MAHITLRISMCGLESEIASRQIRLQQTLPEAMEPIITNDQGEEWYHARSLPASIVIDCKTYLQGCVQKEEYGGTHYHSYKTNFFIRSGR